MSTEVIREVLQLNQQLLDSIARADWAAYEQLCDPSLTAFEPEAAGQRVEGLSFHRFYFDVGGVKGPSNTTICSPNVRLIGDAAVVTYVRLSQRLDAAGNAVTTGTEETRVWQRQNG